MKSIIYYALKEKDNRESCILSTIPSQDEEV